MLTMFQAFVIYADPPDACKPIRPPPNSSEVPNFTGRWAVLIRRYGCNFEVKVRHAQNASFDIAIVHNVNSSELGKFKFICVCYIRPLIFCLEYPVLLYDVIVPIPL